MDSNYFLQDFEQIDGWGAVMKITSEIKAHSGNKCNYVDESSPYSATLTLKNPKIKKIKVIAWCNFSSVDCKGSLCINITDKAELSKQWENILLDQKITKTNTWTKVYLYAIVDPDAINVDNTIRIFVMNNGKGKIYIDDFEIQLAED